MTGGHLVQKYMNDINISKNSDCRSFSTKNYMTGINIEKILTAGHLVKKLL